MIHKIINETPYADSILYNLFHFEWNYSSYRKILLYTRIVYTTDNKNSNDYINSDYVSWAWIYIISNNNIIQTDDRRHSFD